VWREEAILMEYIEKLKEMLCKDLEQYANKGKIAGVELEIIWRLTDTIKNLGKIEMLEENDGYSKNSYDDDSSYARGRRYAKRDSMGRYSRADGYSEEGDSYGRHNSYDIPGADSHDYSREGAKDHMMSKLGKMIENASPEEREVLKDCMRKLERA
jgi:hypothetical protein